MILGDDNIDKVVEGEVEGTFRDVDTGLSEWDASLYNIFITLELVLALTESIDTSGL